MQSRKLKFGLLAVLLLVVIILGGYYGLRDNIHAVIPGQVYRSATLSESKFRQVMRQHHIRSVINLRGEHPDWPWYQWETRIAKEQGAQFYSLPISAYAKPTPSQLHQLVIWLDTVQRPLLVHCKGGSDRTGLASAIVLLLDNQPLSVAEQQISWKYFVYRKSSIGKQVLPYYRRWLKQHNFKSNRQHFLMWAAQTKLN